MSELDKAIAQVCEDLAFLEFLNLPERIAAINLIRSEISKYSPFVTEPVDNVQWVKAEAVQANDYNPNSVAPPEMELLRLSILADGYTQPIVTNREDDAFVVIDGFHRNRVGRECEDVSARIHGYLPVVQIKGSQAERPDRIASTVRHNRARGKHRVEGMSDIVLELKRRNWSDEKIGKQLGMDPDEVLRLAQITGLAEAFKDRQFSEAWEPGNFSDTELESDLEEEIIDEEGLSPLPGIGGISRRDVADSSGRAADRIHCNGRGPDEEPGAV